MRTGRLEDMVKGWFVGDFEPVLHKTDAAEVAVKHYAAGDSEGRHLHKIATELTLIISGEVEMNGRRFSAGDIVVIEAGESTDFQALTESINVVVKVPGAKNDKYVVESNGANA